VQDRGRVGAVTALVLAGMLLAGDLAYNGMARPASDLAPSPDALATTASTAPSAAVPPAAVPSPPPPAPPRPTTAAATTAARGGGPGSFGYASGTGAVLGTAGRLRLFQVAVEVAAGIAPAAFAAAVDQVLGDPRSWIAGGQLRLQRVPEQVSAEFTILLATPGTTMRMCEAGGLNTGTYTSCRLTGRVVINLARWLGSVPGYGAPLATYQAYTINHEVGHELGHRHEACPRRGRPAPVMQQQTLGLAGCVANAWPYLNGRRHQGPPAG
jgi:Protein of unknown function (DUF3152)